MPRRDPTLLDGLVAEVIKQEPYVRPAVCFGSWNIDLSTAARVRPTTSSQLAFDCSGSHSGPCQLARIKWTSDFSVVQRKVPHAQRFPLAQLTRGITGFVHGGFPEAFSEVCSKYLRPGVRSETTTYRSRVSTKSDADRASRPPVSRLQVWRTTLPSVRVAARPAAWRRASR